MDLKMYPIKATRHTYFMLFNLVVEDCDMFDSSLTQKGMELAEHLLNLTVYIFSLKDTSGFVAFYFSSLSAISLICTAAIRTRAKVAQTFGSGRTTVLSKLLMKRLESSWLFI